MGECYVSTPRTALFAVGGVCRVIVCLQGLLEFRLPHPVHFAVLILMAALLYGVNRLFDRLEKASHNHLCPYTTASYMEEREGGRPEYVEG
ncbi:unnamed protein product, partial [Ectocarpus sp. 4 AP-2014]